LSREKVTKYFEIRLFSLVITAVLLFFLFVFFSFFFLWRGQYAYSAAMIAVAFILFLAALRVWRYGKMLEQGARQRNSS
jgi:membrane protein implicated in regulation of membrane protease activity